MASPGLLASNKYKSSDARQLITQMQGHIDVWFSTAMTDSPGKVLLTRKVAKEYFHLLVTVGLLPAIVCTAAGWCQKRQAAIPNGICQMSSIPIIDCVYKWFMDIYLPCTSQIMTDSASSFSLDFSVKSET